MKILILANSGIGLYKFRKELIIELKRKHEVFISLPEDKYVDELKNLGCEYIKTAISRHGTNPIDDLKLLKHYKKTIATIKPDFVLTYTIKPNIYGAIACRRLNIPCIVNITGLGVAVETPGPLQTITLLLYKYALKKAKMVFFQNEENMDFMLRKQIIKGEYGLLPGSGVNLDEYKLIDYPKGDIQFAFIARIIKEKGIDQYLEAAKSIKSRHPEIIFNVCGVCEQDYINQLEQLNKEGIIVYHGQIDDMKSIYTKISCTVHPTYYPEGLSNVLLESCASGRPIITTNRSGCREVIDDGVNGFVVQEKNAEDLIEKIERFINLSYEERRQMGINAHKKVENEFDRRIVINKYLSIINEDKYD